MNVGHLKENQSCDTFSPCSAQVESRYTRGLQAASQPASQPATPDTDKMAFFN